MTTCIRIKTDKLKYTILHVYRYHTKYINNVIFHCDFATGARVWPYKSYCKKSLYSTLSIYTTLIAIVLKDYNAALLCRC